MYKKLAIALSLLMAMSVFAPYAYAAEPDQNVPAENQIEEPLGEGAVPDAVVQEEPSVDPAVEPDSNGFNDDVSTDAQSGDRSTTKGAMIKSDAAFYVDSLAATADIGKVALTWELKWEDGVTGELDHYAIYRDGTLLIESTTDASYTDTSVAPKTTYTYEVVPFAVIEGETDPVEGTPASVEVLTAPNKPGKVNPKASGSFPNTIVSWSAAGVSYQVQIANNKSFSNASEKATTAQSITYTKLVNGKTYYVRVRAIDKNATKTVYGDWEVISFKAKSTGWDKKKGLSYYYVSGVMVKNKEKKIGKLKYYFDKKGVWRGGSKYMWKKAKGKKSGTKNLIVVSRGRHTVCVYQKVGKTWSPIKEYLCSNGKKGSRTPSGSFKVIGKKKSFGKSHTCWYATRWHPKYTAYFHSVLYKYHSMKKIKDGRLGKYVSNGCIRLELANAKWIYKNIKKGTRVYIY